MDTILCKFEFDTVNLLIERYRTYQNMVNSKTVDIPIVLDLELTNLNSASHQLEILRAFRREFWKHLGN